MICPLLIRVVVVAGVGGSNSGVGVYDQTVLAVECQANPSLLVSLRLLAHIFFACSPPLAYFEYWLGGILSRSGRTGFHP